MSPENPETLRRRLAELRVEHRQIDSAIEALGTGPFIDELRLRRLKKRKLSIKDSIARIESALIPDLDA